MVSHPSQHWAGTQAHWRTMVEAVDAARKAEAVMNTAGWWAHFHEVQRFGEPSFKWELRNGAYTLTPMEGPNGLLVVLREHVATFSKDTNPNAAVRCMYNIACAAADRKAEENIKAVTLTLKWRGAYTTLRR